MTLSHLRAALAEEGGTVAATLRPAEGVDASRDRLAAGPRITGHEAEYELLLGMIEEGARLHYGQPQVVLTEDPDLALLLGDQLYALGLTRLAALGDVIAVAELGDAISLLAQAYVAGNPELADAVWRAGVSAVTHGPSEELAQAKRMVREGDRRALEALLETSVGRASEGEARDARRDVDDTLPTPFN